MGLASLTRGVYAIKCQLHYCRVCTESGCKYACIGQEKTKHLRNGLPVPRKNIFVEPVIRACKFPLYGVYGTWCGGAEGLGVGMD